MNKGLIKWVLQLLATAGFLYFAFGKIEISNLQEISQNIDYRPLILIPFILFVDLIINSYRIVSLYQFYGVPTKLFKVVGIKWQGMFFSLIFPLLGDAYKIQSFKTAYGSSYWKNSLVVLLDRLIYTFGLTIVLVPVLFSSLLYLHPVIIWAMVAMLCLEVIIFYVLNKPGIFQKLFTVSRLAYRFFPGLQLHFESRQGYFKEIIYNTCAAIFRHLLMAFTYLLVAFTLMEEITFGIPAFFSVVFLIMLSRVIPVSVGGIGLREYIAVVVFPQIGIASDYALSIALIISSVMVLQGLAGGLFYLINRIRENPYASHKVASNTNEQ